MISSHDEKQNSIFGIGYGISDTTTSYTYAPPVNYKGVVSVNAYFDLFYPNEDSLYLIVFPVMLEGMSGKPLFKRYVSANNTKRYVFDGVVFGRNLKNGYSYVVSAEIVRRSIFKKS